MPNPFDDPAPGARAAANPFDDPHSHTMGRNPFDDAVAGAQRGAAGIAHATHLDSAAGAVGGAMSRLGIPNIINLLDRQRQVTQATVAGGAGRGARTLVHGADQGEQDANRAAVRRRLGYDADYHDDRLFDAIPQPRSLANFERGLVDFSTDTVTDPVSYETLGLGAVARGVGDLAKGAIDATGIAKHPIAREATDYMQHFVANPLTYGGPAKRDLGTPRYNAALAADNRQAAREPEAARRLTERFDAIVAPLTEDEKRTIYRVQNGEAQLTDPASGRLIVPQHVADASHALRKLGMDAAALQANPSGQRFLGYNKASLANARISPLVEPWNLSYAKRAGNLERTRGNIPAVAAMAHPDDAQHVPGVGRRIVGRVDRPYVLPPDLQEFAAPPAQGIMGRENMRRDYLPGPREAAAVAEDAPEKTFNLLRPPAPNLIQRDDISVGEAGEDLAPFDQAWRGMLANAARGGTAGRLRDEVGVPLSFNALADHAMEQLFERTSPARGANRSVPQRAGERWKQLVNIPKNTVTTIGMKHGLVNVPTLAAMSEGPGAALESLVRGAQLSRMSPGDRYRALQQGVDSGVITPFEDRENPIADTLARLPGPVGRAIGGVTKGANNLTWAIDDAAKAAVLRRKLARGMSPDAAAAETMREMVDYRHRSDATNLLSKVAPFATFRSRMPAAIASGTARHPERLLAADRASQGLSSNGNVEIGGHKVTITNPVSDTLELGDEPQKYARATLADPLRALLSPITLPTRRRDPETGEETWKDAHNYFTYGQPLLPHYDDRDGRWKSGFIGSQAAGYAPLSLGQAALQALGGSEFPPEDILSELLGGTLGVRVR